MTTQTPNGFLLLINDKLPEFEGSRFNKLLAKIEQYFLGKKRKQVQFEWITKKCPSKMGELLWGPDGEQGLQLLQAPSDTGRPDGESEEIKVEEVVTGMVLPPQK